MLIQMIHHITFSIPFEKIVTRIPSKTKILSDIIPDFARRYNYNTETEYYNEYKQSFFATTTKKAGWDCMRHYEIIANGCIPYFPNIEECPLLTMALLPKDLLKEGNELYAQFSKKTIDSLTPGDMLAYNTLVNKFLDYTRNNLTTYKLAEYVLKESRFYLDSNELANEGQMVSSIQYPTAVLYGANQTWLEKKVSKMFHATNAFFGADPVPEVAKIVKKVNSTILFLSGSTYPDYLRCLTLHGLKSLMGSKCHDYPKISHIYKTNMNFGNLYGKGMTYSNLLDNSLRDDSLDTNIERLIKKKYFDLIIYGSYHRGMPLLELVNESYKPNEIVLLCGEDIHNCNNDEWVKKGYTVFVREI